MVKGNSRTVTSAFTSAELFFVARNTQIHRFVFYRRVFIMKSTYCRNEEFCNELTRHAKESSHFAVIVFFYFPLDELQFFFSTNLEGQTAISTDIPKMSGVRHDWNLIRVWKLLRRKYSAQTLVADTNFSYLKFHIRHFNIKCSLAGKFLVINTSSC